MPSPPPFIKVGITITFRAPLELSYSPIEQYDNTRLLLSKVIRLACDTFSLYPEFTISGRIHYHGILFIKRKAAWQSSVLPKLTSYGFYKIEQFKNGNDTNWRKYCLKDVDTMKEILHRDLVVVSERDFIEAPVTPNLVAFNIVPKSFDSLPSSQFVKCVPMKEHSSDCSAVFQYTDDKNNDIYKFICVCNADITL